MRDMIFAAGAATLLAFAGSARADLGQRGGGLLILADSRADYGGNQGENGWMYGYYDGDAGVNSWKPGDFELMNVYDNGGQRWWVDNSASGPLTLIDAQYMHPNGFLSPNRDASVQWAVRRWVSSYDAPVNIHVDLFRANPEFQGDGIKLHVFVDGVQTLVVDLFADNDAGLAFDLATTVAQGSVIDFAIDPIGDALFDAVDFHAIITSPVPAPGVLGGLGLAGLLAARRRR